MAGGLQSFRLAAVFITLATFLGCGTAAPLADQPDQVRRPPSEQTAKPGGVFHVWVQGNNVNLNPYTAGGGAAALFNTIYERLVVRDARPGFNWYEDQKIAPWLAERWEQPDRTTFVFHLRKDVSWQDGQPFTAADVVHTVDLLKENRGRLNDSQYAANITRIEALDPHTVRMTLGNPNPDFLFDLYNVELTAKHVADAGKSLDNTAVGTGPFLFSEFETTTGFKVTRNPNYWMKGLPYLDGVAGHYLTDRSTVIAGFVSEALDMINAEDKVQFETVQRSKPDLIYERFYGQYGFGLFFALDTPPFNDVRVRRAINLTADRQDMVAKAAFGEGIINPPGTYGWKKGGAIPPEDLLRLPGYNPGTKQQDIAEAKRLMAESPYPNGFTAKLSYNSTNTNPRPIAEVLASQLEPLGINLVLTPLDNAGNAQALRDSSFEAFILGSRGDDRGELYERFHSKGTFNKKGPKDPELDAVLDQYLSEFDPTAAQRLLQQFQRRLYDQAYFIGAFERSSYSLYQPWVHDVLNNYGANPILWWWPPTAWMDVDKMPANRAAEKLK